MEDCMIKTQELLWQILDTSTARKRSYVLDAIRQLSNHAKKKNAKPDPSAGSIS